MQYLHNLFFYIYKRNLLLKRLHLQKHIKSYYKRVYGTLAVNPFIISRLNIMFYRSHIMNCRIPNGMYGDMRGGGILYLISHKNEKQE